MQVPLLSVIFVLIVLGVVLWLVNDFLPIHPTIKRIITALVVVAVVLWLLSLLLGPLTGIRIV